ncbi:VOC family protein [Novosphingobium colocasiae]|uniref:VOC family protein n=1 Tax=Novosphingobium colocasiae TaxID=1256513 RepID=UPI0035B1572A
MITTGTCQIAYFVPDVRAAALRHHQMFGSGPYYVLDEVSLPLCEYRGQPARWSISSAFGQWGDIQVEFMQQNDALPSFLYDVFPAGSGRFGLHHLAITVSDLHAAADEMVRDGYAIALHARMDNGIEAMLVDTIAENGHMIELYQDCAPLREFYDFVRAESIGFDGTDPVRSFPAA